MLVRFNLLCFGNCHFVGAGHVPIKIEGIIIVIVHSVYCQLSAVRWIYFKLLSGNHCSLLIVYVILLNQI